MTSTLDKFYSIILGYNILKYILYFNRSYNNFSNYINISISSGAAIRKRRTKKPNPSSCSSKNRRRWFQTHAPRRYKTRDVRCGIIFTLGYRIARTCPSTSTWIAARDYHVDIGLNDCRRNGDITQPPGPSALPRKWCWGVWTERITCFTWDWDAVTEMATEHTHLTDTRCTESCAERSEPNEWLWEMKVVACYYYDGAGQKIF